MKPILMIEFFITIVFILEFLFNVIGSFRFLLNLINIVDIAVLTISLLMVL